jgi:hypothetical protein
MAKRRGTPPDVEAKPSQRFIFIRERLKARWIIINHFAQPPKCRHEMDHVWVGFGIGHGGLA